MTNEDGFIQLRCLDRNAQIAESGDASAIRNLTDTVFEFSQVGRVPASFLEEFKDQLVRSELRFRAGDKRGIKEENIVRAVNNLEMKLGAPPYARAYDDEVELLRQESLSSLPHLIRKKATPMSPIESVYLLDLLAYQKVFNETLLLTPEERTGAEHPKLAIQESPTISGVKLVTIHPRVKEMLNFVNNAGRRSPLELIKLAHELMDDLGIDR